MEVIDTCSAVGWAWGWVCVISLAPLSCLG